MEEQQKLLNQLVHIKDGVQAHTIYDVGIQGDIAYGIIKLNGRDVEVEGHNVTLEDEKVAAAEWYIQNQAAG